MYPLSPYILKTFSLYSDKGYNGAGSSSYLQHLQRHEDVKNKQSLQCKKCSLKFLEEKHLRAHLAEDHVSFKDYENVETSQFVPAGEPIQMAQPDERFIKVAVKKNSAVKVTVVSINIIEIFILNYHQAFSQQAAFATQNLEDLAIYDAQGKDYHCLKHINI